MLTPVQIRMARAALRWTQKDLAERSSVFANTIKNIESGMSDPKASTLLALRRAFARAGVEFIDDNGVRLREPVR
jgi:transcriptional regulator with XRE-family HTH domain